MKTPRWFLSRNLVSYVLYPMTWAYYVASRIAFKIREKREFVSHRPVICFGNILSGGVGKTPIVRNIAKIFDAPVVMRGYKKTAETDNIGDEAKMLMSDNILVHVGDRRSNIKLLNQQKSKTPIVMDDGFQNPSIKKDVSVLVFDEGIGFGNGFLLPAGPLREKPTAIQRADAIIVIKRNKIAKNFYLPTNIPIFYATNKEICPYDEQTNIVAFAGIGYPNKFFENIPANVVKKIPFPDHYQYSEKDVKELLKIAEDKNAKLLTTEKDWVRLPEWAKKQIKFSTLKTEIENNFYDWLKERINDIDNKKS